MPEVSVSFRRVRLDVMTSTGMSATHVSLLSDTEAWHDETTGQVNEAHCQALQDVDAPNLQIQQLRAEPFIRSLERDTSTQLPLGYRACQGVIERLQQGRVPDRDLTGCTREGSARVPVRLAL